MLFSNFRIGCVIFAVLHDLPELLMVQWTAITQTPQGILYEPKTGLAFVRSRKILERCLIKRHGSETFHPRVTGTCHHRGATTVEDGYPKQPIIIEGKPVAIRAPHRKECVHGAPDFRVSRSRKSLQPREQLESKPGLELVVNLAIRIACPDSRLKKHRRH